MVGAGLHPTRSPVASPGQLPPKQLVVVILASRNHFLQRRHSVLGVGRRRGHQVVVAHTSKVLARTRELEIRKSLPKSLSEKITASHRD